MTIKISEMTPATTPLAGTELVEVVQGAATRSAPVSELELAKTLAQLDTLVTDATLARTDATQTFTGAQQTGVTTLTDAATIAVDASLNNSFKVTLTAARVLGNPTNVVEGMAWVVRITQDGTGGWALTFDTNYVGNAVTDPLDTSGDGAGADRLLTCYALSPTKIIVLDSLGAAV